MPLLGALSRDLRQAVRSLRRDKGFTATVLLTLALCLGANVVIFTVVRSVLLRPLPFPQADRLVTVYNRYPKAGVEHAGASVPNYYDRRGMIPAFTDIAMVRGGEVTVGDGGTPERVASSQATPSFFHVLGVQPALGRGSTPIPA